MGSSSVTIHIFIRNRNCYNPANPPRNFICAEVHDFAQTLIWQLKEVDLESQIKP